MVSAVRIRGPFLGPSGYDNHVREFARGLASSGVNVELEHLDEWSPVQLPYQMRDPWFESQGPRADTGAVIHFSFPTQVVPDPARPNINFTMFEATRIPAKWAVAHEQSQLIVLPTEHSRRAWIDSGVPEAKLRSCPLGVRTDRYRPGVRPLDLRTESGRPLSSYATRLLNISELGARKNLSGLLAAWLRATSDQDDAVLIWKVGCYNPGSRATFEAEIHEAQRRTGIPLRKAAPIHLLYSLYPDTDMPRLFAAATHYVSLSFGEGWDLSMMQAAASGLRLIAPRHSGYLEYLDDDIASMVSAREQPAITEAGSWISELFEGASWWVPDQDEAIECIRQAVDGRDGTRASARERLAERYTWDAAAERMIEIVEEVVPTPIPPQVG